MEKLNFCGFSGISVKTNSSKTFSGRGHFILGRGTKIGVAFFKAAQSMTILSYRTWYDHFCQISTSLFKKDNDNLIYISATLGLI